MTYEEVAPVLTIQDAIASNSFYENLGPPAFSTRHSIISGDIDAARESYDKASQQEESDVVIVTGEMNVGGQEHFYLETNVTMVHITSFVCWVIFEVWLAVIISLCVFAQVVPMDGGDELCVYSSTQNPTKTQYFVANVTGLPANKVPSRKDVNHQRISCIHTSIRLFVV